MAIDVLSSVLLHYDHDLVAARRRARQVAALLGFDGQDQTRIATVASEIARNALRYGRGGSIQFGVEKGTDGQQMTITVSDQGPGIANLEEVLSGQYRSTTGMGLGIIGARRLMDDFSIETSPERGTTVVMKKLLPPYAEELTNARRDRLIDSLAKQRQDDPLEEVQQQNGELLQALADLNERREELQRLNQELEDTNRGVLALYAELDEKAESLRRADQLKSRFLSDMSHEFRTPVNSILALTRLLDEGTLDDEQKKQVALIRRSAEGLSTLVEDLLDLAKIEAGKIEIRAAEFDVANLFSALRGMLRPLLLNRSLSLLFDDPEGIPPMFTDEGKVSQIVRNFISNAIKFTEAGEVRVSAALSEDGQAVTFSVGDTGIGIAAADLDAVFEEFRQIDSPLQRRQRGTGLGLPLTRKLATLLGGRVGVRSEPNVGSTFFAEIPIRYGGTVTGTSALTMTRMSEPAAPMAAPRRTRILVIDDDETARYTMRSFAGRLGTEIVEAENGLDGLSKALSDRPDLILLDLMMPGIGGHEVLQRLKGDPSTADIPVVVITSRFINEEEKRQILSKAVGVIYKGDLSREIVARAIDGALG
jgi:signal transduction histidine kinase